MNTEHDTRISSERDSGPKNVLSTSIHNVGTWILHSFVPSPHLMHSYDHLQYNYVTTHTGGLGMRLLHP